MNTETTKAVIEFGSMQELFDAVSTHLLTQNRRSMNKDGCAYRSDDALYSCAIGGIMPDCVYEEWMERKSVMDIASEYFARYSRNLFQEEFLGLLKSLQQLHDMYEVEFWKLRLQTIA